MAKEDSGVYAIRNRHTSAVYIGQTYSFRKRWGQHRRQLSAGLHHCKPLQSSWSMWGPDAFEWIVVHNCDTDCMDAFEWWAMRLVPESLILNTATVLNKNPKSGERERRADVARRGAHQAWRIKTGLSKYDNCEVAKMLKKANLKELAEATGISLATLYRARKNGALNISHSKFTAIQAYLSRHEATNGQV